VIFIARFSVTTTSRVILHLQEHLLDVGQAQLLVSMARVFSKHLQLTRRYSIRFNGISLRQECAEVLKETAGDFRRQFYRFGHSQHSFDGYKSGFLAVIQCSLFDISRSRIWLNFRKLVLKVNELLPGPVPKNENRHIPRGGGYRESGFNFVDGAISSSNVPTFGADFIGPFVCADGWFGSPAGRKL
jgi:hypothetical protein